jgi:hypothetical protein
MKDPPREGTRLSASQTTVPAFWNLATGDWQLSLKAG